MINLLEIALFLVKLTMHPSLFFYFHNAAGSRASQEGFFTWSVDFKVFVSKKSPKNRENSVVSYAYRRTDYPTGTDPESGSRSQVGTGIEPILKLQDSESYRNRGFWNRSNTNTYPSWGKCPALKKYIKKRDRFFNTKKNRLNSTLLFQLWTMKTRQSAQRKLQ